MNPGLSTGGTRCPWEQDQNTDAVVQQWGCSCSLPHHDKRPLSIQPASTERTRKPKQIIMIIKKNRQKHFMSELYFDYKKCHEYCVCGLDALRQWFDVPSFSSKLNNNASSLQSGVHWCSYRIGLRNVLCLSISPSFFETLF